MFEVLIRRRGPSYIIVIFLLAQLSGCSGLWHADFGLRKSRYIEKPKIGTLESALSQTSNRTIVILSGDKNQYSTEGTGYHLGIAYETDFLIQHIRHYSLAYDKLKYSYSIDGSSPVESDLDLKVSGWDYIVGMKLWYFNPRISIKKETAEIQSVTGSYVDDNIFFGYGLGLYYDVATRWTLYAAYDKRFRVSTDPLFSVSEIDTTLGVMFHLFGGGGGAGGGTSRFGNPYTGTPSR